MSEKGKFESFLTTTVGLYKASTDEKGIQKVEQKSREKQAAAKERTAQFEAAKQGLFVLTGLTAGILLLVALRTFSRARQLS